MTKTHSPHLSVTTLLTQAVGGGVIAALVNVGVHFLARTAGVSLEGVFAPGQPAAVLGLAPVVLASILPALPTALLAFVLVRFTGDPARVFGAIALVFTLISFAGPAGVAGASQGTKVAMGLMHIVAATGIGGAIHRVLRG
jgi:Family of unknown function (DUF6069)